MLKLKLQYFGHLMQRVDSLEKTLMLGKIEGKRRRGQQRMRWLDSITNSRNLLRLMSIELVMPPNHLMSLSKLQVMVKDREACCVAAHGVVWFMGSQRVRHD